MISINEMLQANFILDFFLNHIEVKVVFLHIRSFPLKKEEEEEKCTIVTSRF